MLGLFFFKQNKISPSKREKELSPGNNIRNIVDVRQLGVVEVLPHLRVEVLAYFQYFYIKNTGD